MQAEAKKGRMSAPKPLHDAEAGGWLLHPRLSVEQLNQDGSLKIRGIDHSSYCGGSEGEACT
eukprot:8713076-Karenia_brevis.AAC.1